MALRGFRDRSHWEGFSERFGLGTQAPGPAQYLGARRVGGRSAGLGAAGARAAGEVSGDTAGIDHGHRDRPCAGACTVQGTCRHPLRAHRPARIGATLFSACEPGAGGDPGDGDLAEPLSPLRPAGHSAGARQRAHFTTLGEELPAPGGAVSPDVVTRHLHRRAERAGRGTLPLHRRESRTYPRGRQHQVRFQPAAQHRVAGRRTAPPAGHGPAGMGGGQHPRPRRRRADRRPSRAASPLSRKRCWCWCRVTRHVSPRWRIHCGRRA